MAIPARFSSRDGVGNCGGVQGAAFDYGAIPGVAREVGGGWVPPLEVAGDEDEDPQAVTVAAIDKRRAPSFLMARLL